MCITAKQQTKSPQILMGRRKRMKSNPTNQKIPNMVVGTSIYFSVIILNVNRLNSPVKTHILADWI